MKRKWFQLVDANGAALAIVDGVNIDTPMVPVLREVVKTKFADSLLAGIAPTDLVVYANRAAFDAKRVPSEFDPIDSLGESPTDPLIVQVPAGIPPFIVLKNAELFSNECGSLTTWEVGVAHEIKLIHEFMEPLGGCTKKGTIFWRSEEQQLSALLMSGWLSDRSTSISSFVADKKSIMVGSPGVGKSTLLCLLAFYVVLKHKKNVLVYRRLLRTGLDSALLYLGWEHDRVVYFSLPRCTHARAAEIYESMWDSAELWLDGFVYKNVPNGLEGFAVLATSQGVDLKSQAGEHAYCCLLPCWRRDDLFALGRAVFKYTEDEMKKRFQYSGGSVRDFVANTVMDIHIAIDHAVSSVKNPEELLSAAAFVFTTDGQADRIRHTFLKEEVEEDEDPAIRFIYRRYWEQVVDSELAVSLLNVRMRADALDRIYEWARRSNNASLAGCVFEVMTHRLAGDNMLKLFVSEYKKRSESRKIPRYPNHFKPLLLRKGKLMCSGTKSDYVNALIKWRDTEEETYWCPGDRGFDNIDSIVKRAPKGIASHQRSDLSTTSPAQAEKCSVAYLQMTVAAKHSIDGKKLEDLNKIFKENVAPPTGKSDSHPRKEADETTATGTRAIADNAMDLMQIDSEQSVPTTSSSVVVAGAEPPIYVAVCPDRDTCVRLDFTYSTNIDEARQACRLYVGYYEHTKYATNASGPDVPPVERPKSTRKSERANKKRALDDKMSD
jgi:hypothetical protein